MLTPIGDVVPFSWDDGGWKYVTNSGGGDSVVPWLPGTPWQTFMYSIDSIDTRVLPSPTKSLTDSVGQACSHMG